MSRKPVGFDIAMGKGFHITFPNGWTVSVQFGAYNYCDHHDGKPASLGSAVARALVGSTGVYCGPSSTAECWAWWDDGKGEIVSETDVLGYQTPEQVARYIMEIMQKPDKRPSDYKVSREQHKKIRGGK